MMTSYKTCSWRMNLVLLESVGSGNLYPKLQLVTNLSVCLEYVIIRSSHEMTQFLEDLDTLNIGSLLKHHLSAVEQLFTYTSNLVSARDLFHLLVPVYLPHSSNVREDEEAVMMNWNGYFQDLEG